MNMIYFLYILKFNYYSNYYIKYIELFKIFLNFSKVKITLFSHIIRVKLSFLNCCN